MKRKRYKLEWLFVLLVFSFAFGFNAQAAEYPSGAASRSSVGISFVEEQENGLTESDKKEDTQLPQTGESTQSVYILLGLLCLFLAVYRKKGGWR